VTKLLQKLLNGIATDFSVVNISEFNDFIKGYIILDELPGDMLYLKREERYDIKKFFPLAKTAVVCVFQYWNDDYEKRYSDFINKINSPFNYLLKKLPKINAEIRNINSNLIARYSLFDDYHKVIRENLEKVIKELKKIDDNIKAKIFVDTSPIFEKILACYGGLGFIGRNTLLINKDFGSYLFIGGFLLNVNVNSPKRIIKSHKLCDNCRICEERCPTKALYNYRLNPLKCISYWTTHNKDKKIPYEIIKSSKYLFGCDICQELCPYNEKIADKTSIFKIPF